MAEDDLDFRHLLYRENSVEDQHNSKENQPPPSSSSSSSSSTTPPTATPTSTGDLAVLEAACKLEDPVCYPGVGGGAAEEVSCILPGAVGPTGGGRWDKSLGVLCQKFIMLFLVTPVSKKNCAFFYGGISRTLHSFLCPIFLSLGREKIIIRQSMFGA